MKAISSSYSTLFSDVTKLSLQDTKRIESFLATLKETMETAIAERAKQVIQNVQREKQALFGGYFARRYQLLLSKSVFSLSELHELNMIYSTLQNHSQDYQELYSVRLCFFCSRSCWRTEMNIWIHCSQQTRECFRMKKCTRASSR